MGTELVGRTETVAMTIRALDAELPSFASAARSERTRAAYRFQLEAFSAWLSAHGLGTAWAEPSTVALYIRHRATVGGARGPWKVSSLAQALAAISEATKAAGLPSPRESSIVREEWKGLRRTVGTAPDRAAPLLAADLARVVDALPDTVGGLRDRALLVLGFACALRRSELVALDVADLRFTRDGLVITVRRSKVDQEGEGTTIGAPYGSNPATCPVRSVRAWLEAAGVADGPVFRAVNRAGRIGGALDGTDVARIVRRSVARIGMDPAAFSGHSLRAGLATSASAAGRDDRAIMRQGRWRSRTMVDRYVREGSLFRDNAAAGLL